MNPKFTNSLSFTLLIILSLICRIGQAQIILPEFGPFFNQNEVGIINVYLPTDSLDQMILEESDEHEYECTYLFANSELIDTLENVAIRLRGNTSLVADKKSFQISFNSFSSGGDWQNLEKINLIGQQNDPSLLRSKLCHDAYRSLNVASARTAFARLYINDQYRGLYLLQEQIDEEFASLYFDDQGNGNLYKCTYPADLDYLGSNPEDYQFTMWGSRPYDLKTNEWADDYTDFAELVDVINTTSDENLICELQKIFHIESYLRVAAVDVLCGHWDNYIFNKNNFYLYHNQRTGLFEYIPYDLDNTLGIDWLSEDWAERDIYEWAPNDAERPLFNRLIENEYGRNLFSMYIDELLNDYFDPTSFVNTAEYFQDLITEAALEDPFRTLDFGFDQDAFLDAITSAWGDPHVDYGLADFVETRNSTATNQLENFASPEVIAESLYNVETVFESNSTISIEAEIQGENAANTLLEISFDNANFETFAGLNDIGTNGDLVAEDGIFSVNIPNTSGEEKMYYRLAFPDGTFYPCVPKMIWLSPTTPGLYINEVMSNNISTIADDFGEFNDWVELYNGGTSAVTLSGKFITDNLYDWNKFPLPEISLDPGEFILVWLDNDPFQGPLHASFRLDSNDEELWLISQPSGSPRVIDFFTPCVSTADNSQERIIDGGSEIAITDAPTAGSSNMGVHVSENPLSNISIFPNPANDRIYFSEKMSSVEIYDMTGRLISRWYHISSLDLDSITPGQYCLKLFVENDLPCNKMVIIEK
jgi:spore coat protein H